MSEENSSDTAKPPRSPAGARRPVRSYVIRGGRLTDSQRKAIEAYWDDYVIDYQPEYLDFSGCFGRRAPLVVEIGFGMGDSLLEMAARRPDLDFVGIEVHRPGVGKLLHGLAEAALTNLRVICHDANEVLRRSIEDESLDRLQIFFPDPWHKKRHHKRRLIQDDFVALMGRKLKPGGVLHLATDWEPYAEQMLDVMERAASFRNEAEAGHYSDPGDRPVTKFERRGKRLGHGVWDLRYVRL